MQSDYTPDLSIVKDDGTVALVEIKARSNTTSDWADALRRALVGDDLAGRYFLLVARDNTFLWSDEDGTHLPSVFQSNDLFGPILGRARVSLDSASEETLALALSEWLLEFTLNPLSRENGLSPDESVLVDFGRRVRNGTIVREPISA
jgi:hypothetical protein